MLTGKPLCPDTTRQCQSFSDCPKPEIVFDNTVHVKLLNPDAKMPTYAKSNDAAMDLCSSETTTIPSNQRKLISTGVSLAIPNGYYGRVAPRSGLSLKGMDIGGGVVDAGYRGEVKIILINNSSTEFVVNKGDRVAQLIITKIMDNPVLKQVDTLPESDRGSAGFGSTGTN
jgi:dUTP pyrophosphatase